MNESNIKVESERVKYTKSHIFSHFDYHKNDIKRVKKNIKVIPKKISYIIRTDINVKKTGLMLVGMGGNNGSTLIAGTMANKLKLKWNSKEKEHSANFLGSITQSGTMKIGDSSTKEEYVLFKEVLPMLRPEDIVFSGWDINGDNMKDAMIKAKVIDYDLQKQLFSHMEKIKPLPSIYFKDFIAANQKNRANNLLNKSDKPSIKLLNRIREDIRSFKKTANVENVIVLWTANTERFCVETKGVHDSEANLLKSIKNGHSEISPSQIFALASIYEKCAYINGSPQNTFVPGIIEAANKFGVFLAGDDFKSGQTKVKSVITDFLVSTALRPRSIASYNHLGNNDGKNLSSKAQFSSKQISKTNVIDDIISSNENLFKETGPPDHCVVIKYIPASGDEKKALDEYSSEIFLDGKNHLVIYNTCEDSLLAAPIIMDMVIMTELFQRIGFCKLNENLIGIENGENGMPLSKKIKSPSINLETLFNGSSEPLNSFLKFSPMHSILSSLSYFLKAPKVPKNTPIINSLFRQRSCLENLLRACLGLQPESNMLLEHKICFNKNDYKNGNL